MELGLGSQDRKKSRGRRVCRSGASTEGNKQFKSLVEQSEHEGEEWDGTGMQKLLECQGKASELFSVSSREPL